MSFIVINIITNKKIDGNYVNKNSMNIEGCVREGNRDPFGWIREGCVREGNSGLYWMRERCVMEGNRECLCLM